MKLYVIIHEFDFLLYIKRLIIFDALFKDINKKEEFDMSRENKKRKNEEELMILGFSFFFRIKFKINKKPL